MATSKMFLVLLAIFSSASAARIVPCKSTGTPDLKHINITGCSPRSRDCIFKKGKSAAMELPFTPKYEAQNVTAVVHGIIAGIPIPFPLPNKDACKNSGLKCPLLPKTPVTYSAELPVSKSYPSVRVTVKWELKDEKGVDIVCIKFPVRLQ